MSALDHWSSTQTGLFTVYLQVTLRARSHGFTMLAPVWARTSLMFAAWLVFGSADAHVNQESLELSWLLLEI